MRFQPGRCLLHQLYADKKISQRELSSMTGYPESQLSDYANNRTKMGLGTAVTIARAMKLRSVDDLYEWIVVE